MGPDSGSRCRLLLEVGLDAHVVAAQCGVQSHVHGAGTLSSVILVDDGGVTRNFISSRPPTHDVFQFVHFHVHLKHIASIGELSFYLSCQLNNC